MSFLAIKKGHKIPIFYIMIEKSWKKIANNYNNIIDI